MAQLAGKFNASCRARLKICPASRNCSPGARIFRKISRRSMKAKIIVTPKKAVVDPQGKTVQGALEQMGYQGVTGVHVGKYIEIDLAPGTDKTAAEQALNAAAHKFLSNPIIEDYKLEMTE
jgi:phosphoribosylformylglycinamidine synthase PurS subunit